MSTPSVCKFFLLTLVVLVASTLHAVPLEYAYLCSTSTQVFTPGDPITFDAPPTSTHTAAFFYLSPSELLITQTGTYRASLMIPHAYTHHFAFHLCDANAANCQDLTYTCTLNNISCQCTMTITQANQILSLLYSHTAALTLIANPEIHAVINACLKIVKIN